MTGEDFWDTVDVVTLDGTWCSLRACPLCGALVLTRTVDRHIEFHEGGRRYVAPTTGALR